MLETITVTQDDIFHEVQLSCKIPEMMDKIIERQIISSVATEAGIEVTKEELQKASDRMRATSQLKDARATWVWLDKYALSLDDFEEIVYCTLIAQKVSNHLFADLVEPHFYEHQLDYAGAVISEIVLDDEDEAIELYYEIEENEISFIEASQEYIQDPKLRQKAGYCGKVTRSDLKPEVSAAVFAVDTPTPTVLKPITTADGIYLVLVSEIIKPELNQGLRNQIMFDLYSEWLEQQIQKVQVVSHLKVSDRVA